MEIEPWDLKESEIVVCVCVCAAEKIGKETANNFENALNGQAYVWGLVVKNDIRKNKWLLVM